MKDHRRIRDPIYDIIKFNYHEKGDKLLWEIINTSPLQRLRRIKQLGFSEFVYPGACHSRFAHSLGAMQMARWMITVLNKNRVIKKQRSGKANRPLATLCAMLLHDTGHGPFSHVFEEVSQSNGISISHEDYTVQIIKSDEVSSLLEKFDVRDEVLSLSESETTDVYKSIVSSQMDADRLDFLVRDRYFTGVRFGSIDIQWLLDSLIIVDLELEPGSTAKTSTFALNAKGLSVAEDYLKAYTALYNAVYFHKTTRAVQYLVQDILNEAFNEENREKLDESNPLVRYFSDPKNVSLERYSKIDDSNVLSLIHFLSGTNVGNASALSKRFLERNLYKCFQPPKRPKEEPPRGRISAFLSALKDKKIFYHFDRIPDKGYKQYDIMTENFVKNILVYSDYDKDYKPIADLAPSVNSLADVGSTRFYFNNKADLKIASGIWDKL